MGMSPPLINWWAAQPKQTTSSIFHWRWAVDLGLGVSVGWFVLMMGWGGYWLWQQQQLQHWQQHEQQEQAQQQLRRQQVAQQELHQLQLMQKAQADQQRHLQAMVGQWLQHLPAGVSWSRIEWRSEGSQWKISGQANTQKEAWQAFQVARDHPLWGKGLRWEASTPAALPSGKPKAARHAGVEVVWMWAPPSPDSHDNKEVAAQRAGS